MCVLSYVKFKTFKDLNQTINGVDSETVTLDGIYVYDSEIDHEFENGINITRNVVIDGQDAVIDGAKI